MPETKQPNIGTEQWVQCRHEMPFKAVIKARWPHQTEGYSLFIDCPNCGREYTFDSVTGEWHSDRPLIFLTAEEAHKLCEEGGWACQ
jgi:hypothetical protein